MGIVPTTEAVGIYGRSYTSLLQGVIFYTCSNFTGRIRLQQTGFGLIDDNIETHSDRISAQR